MKRREKALALLIDREDDESLVEAAARALALGLGYRYAAICRHSGDRTLATVLALWDGAAFTHDVTYALEGTPCQKVAHTGKTCFHGDEVVALFPDDHFLVEWNACSYHGAVVRDRNGSIVGHVAAVNDQPDPDGATDGDFVQLIARWVGTEFDRLSAVEALEEERQRLHDFTEASADWVWETNAGLRFTSFSPSAGEDTPHLLEARLGRTPFEIALPDDDKDKWDELRKDMAAGIAFRDFIFRTMSRKGQRYIYRVNGKPMLDANGCFIGYRGTAADITSQIEAEELVARQSEILRVIMEHIDQGISLMDADLRLVASNEKFLELLDLPADLLRPGVSLESVLRYNAERGEYGPGDPEAQVRERMELARSGRPHRFERSRANGAVIEVSGKPLPQGGFITTYADVTERKRAEEALRQSEERYALAMAGANEGLWDWDITKDEVYLSPRVQTIVGLRNADLRTTPQEWLKRVHPDDVTEYNAAVIAHLKGDSDHFEFQYRARHADGHYRWLLDRGLALRDESGRAYRMAGSMGDITERKQAQDQLRRAEENYRKIFENAVEGIYQADREGRWLSLNPAMAAILGFDTPEQMIREHTDIGSDLYVDPQRREQIIRIVEREGMIQGCESEVRRRDGDHIWISESVSAVRDERGEIRSLEGVVEDITDRKHFEHILRTAKDEAETANRTKSEFLANMSHELRTPLNAILGFSEIMVSEMFGPIGRKAYREYAQDINDSGAHLLNVINDILDVSKAEAGKIDLVEAKVNVTRTIESSLRLLRKRADAGGVLIEVKAAPNLPELLADEHRLRQILLNLLTNAIKFTKRGGRVTVAAAGDSISGFTIEVKDTGIGMAPQDIPRALAPFAQVDSQLTRRYEGTGLGLPLSKALVDLHGGTLAIESEPEVGTSVTVHLPATRVLSEERCVS